MKSVYAVAERHGLPLHLDGARIFNAAVALGVPAKEIAACATTVQFCLSKGLGAPIGSLIAGPRDWIAAARRWRKRLGGGMRQAGVIAAAGIVALETMVDRLAEDHANARFLAEGLAALPGLGLDPAAVETNIVIFKTTALSAPALVEALRRRGVLCGAMDPERIRFTTNKDVSRKDVEEALAVIKDVLRQG